MPIETEFFIREQWHGGVYARGVEQQAAMLAADASPEAQKVGARLLACLRCTNASGCRTCPFGPGGNLFPHAGTA